MSVPRSRPGVIRLDSSPSTEDIEVRRDGRLLLKTSEPARVAAKLVELGVANPAPLVRAVLHFNAVEIDRAAQTK